MNVTSSGFSR